MARGRKEGEEEKEELVQTFLKNDKKIPMTVNKYIGITKTTKFYVFNCFSIIMNIRRTGLNNYGKSLKENIT